MTCFGSLHLFLMNILPLCFVPILPFCPTCFNLLSQFPIAWLSVAHAVWWKANQVEKEAPDMEIKWSLRVSTYLPAWKPLAPQLCGDKISVWRKLNAHVAGSFPPTPHIFFLKEILKKKSTLGCRLVKDHKCQVMVELVCCAGNERAPFGLAG